MLRTWNVQWYLMNGCSIQRNATQWLKTKWSSDSKESLLTGCHRGLYSLIFWGFVWPSMGIWLPLIHTHHLFVSQEYPWDPLVCPAKVFKLPLNTTISVHEFATILEQDSNRLSWIISDWTHLPNWETMGNSVPSSTWLPIHRIQRTIEIRKTPWFLAPNKTESWTDLNRQFLPKSWDVSF